MNIMQALALVNTEGMSRDEWLQARKQGIGGSEIAAIMSRNPWETPLGVYLQKTGQIPPKEQNEAMYWGTRLEAMVAEEFEMRSGMKVQKIEQILQHEAYPFCLANIDRLIIDPDIGNAILECKNVGLYSQSEWRDGCPEHYRIQLNWYLGVTGLQHGYIAALIGGNQFIYHYIPRDDALIEDMFTAACDFWYNHVLEQNPPAATERDEKTLSALHPAHEDGKVLNLAEADQWLINDLCKARKALKETQEQEDLAKNRIKERMQDAEMLLLEGEKICSWKANSKGVRTFKILRGGE